MIYCAPYRETTASKLPATILFPVILPNLVQLCVLCFFGGEGGSSLLEQNGLIQFLLSSVPSFFKSKCCVFLELVLMTTSSESPQQLKKLTLAVAHTVKDSVQGGQTIHTLKSKTLKPTIHSVSQQRKQLPWRRRPSIALAPLSPSSKMESHIFVEFSNGAVQNYSTGRCVWGGGEEGMASTRRAQVNACVHVVANLPSRGRHAIENASICLTRGQDFIFQRALVKIHSRLMRLSNSPTWLFKKKKATKVTAGKEHKSYILVRSHIRTFLH